MGSSNTVEARLERNFVKWLQDLYDCYAVKGPTATSKGFPDRFIQLPKQGGTIYVEFKGTSYYSLTPLQVWWRDTIIASSPNRYFLIDNDEDLEALKEMCIAFMSIGERLATIETDLLKQFRTGSIPRR